VQNRIISADAVWQCFGQGLNLSESDPCITLPRARSGSCRMPVTRRAWHPARVGLPSFLLKFLVNLERGGLLVSVAPVCFQCKSFEWFTLLFCSLSSAAPQFEAAQFQMSGQSGTFPVWCDPTLCDTLPVGKTQALCSCGDNVTW